MIVRFTLGVVSCLSTCGAFAEVPQVVLDHANSVCIIKTCKGSGSCSYLGGGYWLTNRHVVCDCGAADVFLRDGGRVSGAVVARGVADLALVKSQPVDLTPIPLASEPLNNGELAYPVGYDNSKDLGTWPTQKEETWKDSRVVYVGTGSRKGNVYGNSGGPVLNSRGELLSPMHGNTHRPTIGEGVTIAIGFHPTRDFLKRFFKMGDRRQDQCPDGQCQPQQTPRGKLIPSIPIPPVAKQAAPLLEKLSPSPSKPTTPPEVSIDYGKVADLLIPMMAEDPRFRGPPGKDAVVDIDELVSRVKREVANSLRYKVVQ